MTDELPLPHTSTGSDPRPPLVFLHGFCTDRSAWQGVSEALAGRRREIVFDLPGHGAALAWSEPVNAAIAAKAVLASLEALGVPRCHLIGHSLGGATAVLIALMQPERIASLTLLAPGGFGYEVNDRLLTRYATATSTQAVQAAYEGMFGFSAVISSDLIDSAVENRSRPGALASYQAILPSLSDQGVQKQIDRSALFALPMPIKVVWGTQDRVLPTRQAHRLPGHVASHVFEDVGHMLPYEIPEAIAKLVLQNAAVE